MATTKIHAIKSTLNKAIKYIENPEKTDGSILVSGFNVEPETAAIEFKMTAEIAMKKKGDYCKNKKDKNIAYHLIQSFSPEDKVNPEQAHEIGKKLAEELLGEKFEYVIATHIDKEHIHNHIIINAVSFKNYKKFRTQPYKTASKIRAISDRICAENNLSVIENNEKKGITYKEWSERKNNRSWKSEIRKILNYALEKSKNFEEFVSLAAELGVEVNSTGKHIKYKFIEGQIKYVRGNKLADTDYYTYESIIEKLENNKNRYAFLKNLIINNIENVEDLSGLETILRENGIYRKVSKQGKVSYKFIKDDEENISLKEENLPKCFWTESLKEAIRKKNKELLSDESLSIEQLAEDFNNKTHAEGKLTEVRIKKEDIVKFVIDGALIKVNKSASETGLIFVNKKDLFFEQESGDCLIKIGSNFDYYFTMRNLDPDVLESEQLSDKSIKGENIIRQMELKYDVKPVKIKLLSENVKSISAKGVFISSPEQGFENVFIEKEYVEFSNAKDEIYVNIYKNWSYTANVNDANNERWKKNIKGGELIDKLEKLAEINEKDNIYNRIMYYERKEKIKISKQLAEALNLIRSEKIENIDELKVEVAALENRIKEIKNIINETAIKNDSYKNVLKQLTIYNKYLHIKEKESKISFLAKKGFESKWKDELVAFNNACTQLEKMGVNFNVNPEKLLDLIQAQETKTEELSKELNQVEDQLKKVKNIERIIDNINKSEREKTSVKEKQNNIEL